MSMGIDRKMNVARGMHDWTTQLNLSIDKENAIRIRKSRYPREEKVCTMCGELCAIKMLEKYLSY